MLLCDLFEERRTLPLRKDAIDAARGRYAAFVCVMHPRDFIRLTTYDEEGVEQIIRDTHNTTLADYAANTSEYMRKDWNYLPFLDVRYSTGRVLGHEGRHRAALVLKAGGRSFPCGLHMKADVNIVLRYTDGEQEHTEEFGGDVAAAEARKNELLLLKDEWGHKKFFDFEIKWETYGGGLLKGHPERSENWNYAKWTVEDAPKVLIGQFDPSVRVTNFKIGLVKGYHHFKR